MGRWRVFLSFRWRLARQEESSFPRVKGFRDAIRDAWLFATSFSSTLNSGSLGCKQLCSGASGFWGHWAEMVAALFNFWVWGHLELCRKNRQSSCYDEIEHCQICPNIGYRLWDPEIVTLHSKQDGANFARGHLLFPYQVLRNGDRK